MNSGRVGHPVKPVRQVQEVTNLDTGDAIDPYCDLTIHDYLEPDQTEIVVDIIRKKEH